MINRSATWVGAAQGGERFNHAEEEAALARVTALAKVMDSVIAIPGTNVRIGVDAVLGVIPVAGDLISQAISTYIIWEARRLGVSHLTMGRMIANTLVDTVVGAIPLVGDAFDVMFRANSAEPRAAQERARQARHGRPVIDV